MLPRNFRIQVGSLSIVSATDDDAKCIYPFMRSIDQLECACAGHTPLEALRAGLKYDEVTLTGLDPQGEPFVMFGSGVGVDNMPYIWLLGTDAVTDYGYDFLKASRRWAKILTQPYGAAMNVVHKDNAVARRWLKFIGAVFLRDVEISGHPFSEFVISN